MSLPKGPLHEEEGTPFIGSWEGTAKIFVSNLLYGTDEHTKEKSAEVLITIAKALDDVIAEIETKFGTPLPKGASKDAT